MKYLPIAALLAVLPTLALADAPAPLGANGGKFGNWTAATYGTGAAKICYAFTTPQISKPNWKSRGKVMLTVTQRHGSRDEVSLTAGYAYPKTASVKLTVGTTPFDFYTSGANAFTSSGTAVVTAFKSADSAATKGTGPKGKPVEDSFSLTGFSAAYKAISAACP
ncbi:invasion associated locus B family protein [Acidocella aromatica]|uniref:Invasion protein IalB n=1 Tax=Acidocella aromatica TaxID=1303579 RepID=A0A840V9U9_9PROT|nr:invasion associated locus B family protein [Acidocella aromatica]MBB5372533.1 invasion protein IalB [Acidocella aromatica]